MTEEDPWAAAAQQQEKDENFARLSNKMEKLDTGAPSASASPPFGATSKVFGAFKMPDNITPGSTHAFGSSVAGNGPSGTSSFGGNTGASGGGGGGSSFGGGGSFGGGFGGGGFAPKSAAPTSDEAGLPETDLINPTAEVEVRQLGRFKLKDEATPPPRGGFARQASQEDIGGPVREPGWGSPPATPEHRPSPPSLSRGGAGLPGGWGGVTKQSPPPWAQHDDRTDATDSYGEGSHSNFSSGLGRPAPKAAPPHAPPPPETAQECRKMWFQERTTRPIVGWGDAPESQANGTSSSGGPESGWTEEELREGEGNGKASASVLNKILHDQLVKIGELDVDINNLPTSSPLFSVKSFYELRLKEDLVKGVTMMGFHAPSKIQEVALPVLIGEPPTNMVAQSQSGTGKTAAFVLTMLNRVDASCPWPQCLCLAPTYELAMQIGEVVQKMGQFLDGVRVCYAVRGNRVPRGAQITDQIVIGTPGTAMDWIIKLRVLDPTKLRVFVLDEADVMISEQGHKDQSIRIKHALSPACQLLLFSATYDNDVMAFAEQIVTPTDDGEPPVIITVRREEQTLDTIRQFVVRVHNREEKFEAINNFYGCLTIGQSIIFCHTKVSAKWLAQKMCDAGHNVGLLSGELGMEERAEVIHRFKNGLEKVLITTNVCSRGIDVRQVTLVINYDVPMLVEPDAARPGRFRTTGPDFETYLHRIGRTGRFGKAGIAVNFVDSDFTADCIRQITQHFGKAIPELDPTNLDALEAIEESRKK